MAVLMTDYGDWNIKDNTVYFDKGYYTLAGYEQDEFPP
jgi:hypothetical protein